MKDKMTDDEKLYKYEQAILRIENLLTMPWTGTYCKECIREELNKLKGIMK